MKAVLTVLGSGTSMGVPTVGCTCAVCASSDPHDRRLRPSIMVQYDGHTVVIDTSPDFREQAIREQIRRIDAVLYTHGHADHILGLDDVRPLSFPRVTGGGKIPLYASHRTAQTVQSVFRYIFDGDYKYGGLAQVEMHIIDGPVELFGARFTPLVVNHGEYPIEAYRFGSAAYLTDFSTIPEETMAQLRGLDILILDALRHHPHPTHSTLENSLQIAEQLQPKRTFFTHMSHDLPHQATNAALPPNVRLSYDGLKLEFEI
ncbi:MAG TPA: MBL fold metallo-hydrolase [Candidatus Angelobacter sp.]|jgi:phosphoribosyl 1,2-cyclic phosphate phosphodiesterase|nr:MBL fold metallo-hydrolase [Candidatus Angelobacter sp.]